MSIDEIIEEITLGLTGDTIVDMVYLREKSVEYSKHEFANELNNRIGEVTLGVLRNKEEKLNEESIVEKVDTINKLYEEAQKLSENKKFIEAKKVIESIFEILPFKNEGGNLYFSFGSVLELFLFTLVFQPDRPINQVKTDNSSIYKLYAYIQAQLYKIPEAIQALEDSLKWDPLNIGSLIELAEISKRQGEYDKFLNLIRNALALSLSSNELAICYIKLAEYYKEQEKYETAICLYYISYSFRENPSIMSELTRMNFDLNIETTPPSLERTKEILQEIRIQLGASEYAQNATIALAKESKKNNAREIYEYCKDVYKDLTKKELEV